MRELTPFEIASRIRSERDILADNAKAVAKAKLDKRNNCMRYIEDYKINHPQTDKDLKELDDV